VSTIGSHYKFNAKITHEPINNDKILYFGRTDKNMNCIMIVLSDYDPTVISLTSLVWDEQCCTTEGRPLQRGKDGTVRMAMAALTLASDRFDEWDRVEFTDKSSIKFDMPESSIDIARGVIRRGFIPLADYYVLTHDDEETWYASTLHANPLNAASDDVLRRSRSLASSMADDDDILRLIDECKTQSRIAGNAQWYRDEVQPHIERLIDISRGSTISWRTFFQGLKKAFGLPMMDTLFRALPIALATKYVSLMGTSWRIERTDVESYAIELVETSEESTSQRGGFMYGTNVVESDFYERAVGVDSNNKINGIRIQL
jgi:hypothetical protein